MKVAGIVLLVVVTCCSRTFAQKSLLNKSWIKESIEDFTKKKDEPDTTYLRYVIDNSTVTYGFEPYSNSIQKAIFIIFKKLE